MNVAKLYIEHSAIVADLTWAKGVFWRRIKEPWFTLIDSDVRPMPGIDVRADFSALPYRDGSFDVVVLDPPYMHDSGSQLAKYGGNETTGGMGHEAIIALYGKGIAEASRVLKPRGFLFVKCQDEIESGRQRWSHTEIKAIAEHHGLAAKDLFVLVPHSSLPSKRWARQRHVRKRHSYLWVFRRK